MQPHNIASVMEILFEDTICNACEKKYILYHIRHALSNSNFGLFLINKNRRRRLIICALIRFSYKYNKSIALEMDNLKLHVCVFKYIKILQLFWNDIVSILLISHDILKTTN